MDNSVTMEMNVSRKDKRRLSKFAKQAGRNVWTFTLPDSVQYRFLGQIQYIRWRRFLDWVMFWKRELSLTIQILGPPDVSFPSPSSGDPGNACSIAGLVDASSLIWIQHRRPGRCEQLDLDPASPSLAGGDE